MSRSAAGEGAETLLAVPGAGALDEPDDERRFGGLRRLHGAAAYARLRAARLAVVGVGGVGSWAAEALARCGVARLVLIDLDHVAESNVNRQVQALTATLGQAKVQALRERIAQIHPGCEVIGVEDFVEPGNWPALLPAGGVDGLIDACDQSKAKLALADWARRERVPFVSVGAAGGKLSPQQVEVEDLSLTTHDPLLAGLRQRLRKLGAPRTGRMGVRCVFSRESVRAPEDAAACDVDGSLNCHGYGSSVTVTATFGLVAAAELIRQVTAPRR